MNALATRPTQALAFDVLPPSDESAERSVLGAIMIDTRAADVAFELLESRMFYHPRPQKLFTAMQRIYQVHSTLEELVVRNALGPKVGPFNSLDERDDYIKRLIIDTGSAANIEVYCQLVRKKWQLRTVLVAAQIVMQGVQNGENAETLVGQFNEHTEAIQETNEEKSGVFQQVEDELQGKRKNIRWPNCPRVSSTLCFLPGTLTVLCGSPGSSKSMFVVELIWRLLLCECLACVLELESGNVMHMRRAIAQHAEYSDYINPDKTPHNAMRCAQIEQEQASFEKMLRDKRAIQGFPMVKQKTVQNVLHWIGNECKRGRQLLAIDSVSAISGGRDRLSDENRLINGAKEIAEKYGARILFVVHPKMDGKFAVRPGENGIRGSSNFVNLSDTVLWLERHKPLEDGFWPIDPYGEEDQSGNMEPQRYNATMHLIKLRLAKRIKSKIAVYADGATLQHHERGWL